MNWNSKVKGTARRQTTLKTCWTCWRPVRVLLMASACCRNAYFLRTLWEARLGFLWTSTAETCSLTSLSHLNSLCPQVCAKTPKSKMEEPPISNFCPLFSHWQSCSQPPLAPWKIWARCRAIHNSRRGKEKSFVCLFVRWNISYHGGFVAHCT